MSLPWLLLHVLMNVTQSKWRSQYVFEEQKNLNKCYCACSCKPVLYLWCQTDCQEQTRFGLMELGEGKRDYAKRLAHETAPCYATFTFTSECQVGWVSSFGAFHKSMQQRDKVHRLTWLVLTHGNYNWLCILRCGFTWRELYCVNAYRNQVFTTGWRPFRFLGLKSC